MKLHELIDLDEPKCLYCRGQCFLLSTGSPGNGNVFCIDNFTCKVCQETFSIFSQNDEIFGFQFECSGIDVYYDYAKETMEISRAATDTTEGWIEPVVVPVFETDFSNKENLFRKLRLYLTFA